MCSVFSDKTWNENRSFRNKNKNINCIYGSPMNISESIPTDSLLYIVEMNNSTNKIEGIGIIRNKPFLDKTYPIYEERNYTRYIFKGKYRMDREQIEKLSSDLILILEYILFKEKTHMKRSTGISKISQKIINNKKDEFINKLDVNYILKLIKLCFLYTYKRIENYSI